MGRDASALQAAKLATHRTDLQGPRIEVVVDGEPHPFCARNRLLGESGRFWRGYRLEHVRIPPNGMLQPVSATDHLLFFVAAGTCRHPLPHRHARREAPPLSRLVLLREPRLRIRTSV